MSNISCLIAAAGKGSRSGLKYPKTLFLVNKKPILIHIIERFEEYDECPTIIVSPEGLVNIQTCLDHWGKNAHLVVQEEPLGMGNAVLQFSKSPSYKKTKDVILAWGDIPFLQAKTIKIIVEKHVSSRNTFTFPTRKVDLAYTVVKRNECGKIQSVIETREKKLKALPGERDIGLFIFDKSTILESLKENCEGKFGGVTLEHGFLYIIEILVRKGFLVEAMEIAEKQELISLNKLTDLDILL